MPTKTTGATAVTTTETDLFSVVTSDSYHSCSISLGLMVSGDVYVFRCYGYDDTLGGATLNYTETKSGIQTETKLTFNPIAESHYRVTAQKISGTNHTFNWTRWV